MTDVMAGYDLSGQVAVLTGAGSGIGRACALAAAKSGLAVAVWDLNASAAADTVKLIKAAGMACGGSLKHWTD